MWNIIHHSHCAILIAKDCINTSSAKISCKVFCKSCFSAFCLYRGRNGFGIENQYAVMIWLIGWLYGTPKHVFLLIKFCKVIHHWIQVGLLILIAFLDISFMNYQFNDELVRWIFCNYNILHNFEFIAVLFKQANNKVFDEKGQIYKFWK